MLCSCWITDMQLFVPALCSASGQKHMSGAQEHYSLCAYIHNIEIGYNRRLYKSWT